MKITNPAFLLKKILASLLIFFLVFTPQLIAPFAAYAAINGTLTSAQTVANVVATNDQTAVTATTVANVVAGTNDQTAVTATTVANVVAVAQISTITITGTVEATDVYTAHLPGAVDAIYTVTTDTTTSDIATGLNNAIQASAGYAGQAFTSNVSTNVITLTAKVAGTGFTVTSDATDVGGNADGAATYAVTTANVVAVAQVNTITIGGTVDTGDVFTATLPTVGAVNYTVTGGDTTTSNIATGLNNAIQASAGYAGQAFTSGVATNVITLTAKVAGTGFTQTSGATNRAAVAQVNTITIGGTVEAGDVITATLPTVGAVNYTVQGGDTTTTHIATGLNNAIQASAGYAGQDFTSNSSGNVVTLTAKVAGTGFTQTSGTTNRTPVAQVVTFTPGGSITAGETYRINLNGTNYNYLVIAGNTTTNIVNGLVSALSGNPAATCVNTTNTLVTCTAVTPGTALTSYSSIVVDETNPTAFTVGTVVTTGGTITAGKWNATNTGVNVTVPVANDPTLTGGTIQVQAEADGSFSNLGSAYTILVGDLNTNKQFSFTDTELEGITGFSEGDNITFRAVITDSNTNATTGTISGTSLDVDQVTPTFTASRTGQNTIVVTFNENVSASDTSTSAWTLSAGTVAAATQPSSATTLTLTISGLSDTSATPTVTYVAASGTVLDAAGNEVANGANAVAADNAAPILVSSQTRTTTTIDVTFSENLNAGTVAAGDFTVASNTVSGVSVTNAVVTLTLGSAIGTGATPAVSLVSGVNDSVGNILASAGPVTPTDGIVPTLSPVSITTDNSISSVFGKVGTIVTVSFTSSESISTPTVTIAGSAAVVTGGPTSWSASRAFVSGDTEGVVGFNIAFADTTGNSGVAVTATTDASSVTLDKTVPVTPGIPSTTTPTNSTNQTWTWTAATDALSGINNYFYRISGSTTVALTALGNVLTFGTSLTEGVYSFFVTARDRAGNLSAETSAGTLVVDTTSPTVTVTNPLSGASTTPSFTLSTTTSENATCTYALDGGAVTAMSTTGTTSHSQALASLATGAHSVVVACTDSATNSTSLTRSWTVLAASGSTIDGSSSSPAFSSSTGGQADVPSGITSITMGDNTSLNVSGGVSTAGGGNLIVAGVSIPLNNFTSGNISGVNLNNPQYVGGQLLTLTKAVKLESGTNTQPIVLTNTNYGGATVSIPDGTTILAPSAWDGTIKPTVSTAFSGNAIGSYTVGGSIVEIGSSNVSLVFDRPVTVVLPVSRGEAAYKAAGSSTWTRITNVCGGTYDNPTSPVYPGECAIDNGTSTKILTYHFTTFGTLSFNGVGSSSQAQQCSETNKPKSAPTLLSAVASGDNRVTLTWSKADDPVTYYLVAYGTSSGSLMYGNPNIGDKNTTSFTVDGLSGDTTYYFRVRGGNGCLPGDYSNEVAVTTTGGGLSGIAQGFIEGVLGDNTVDAKEQETQIPGDVQASETEKIESLLSVPAAIAGNNKFLLLGGGVVLAFALGGLGYFFFIRKP